MNARRPKPKPSRKFDPLLPAPTLSFEAALWDEGLLRVAGVDEAGRGALAGPVAAGVVILPPDPALAGRLAGVRDSKQMTPAQRSQWAVVIKREALAWAVGMASAAEIDALGIAAATRLAATRALGLLEVAPQHLLLDWFSLPELALPQTPLVKGDRRSLSIAAASVLAKTERDALLLQYDSQYPGYGLAAHKGYGAPLHLEQLRQRGPSPIHRLSFAPLSAQRTLTQSVREGERK